MADSHDILQGIVSRSGIDRRQGYSLYRYRVSPDEVEQLRYVLMHQFIANGILRSVEDSAAFCLFGAEWFRRKYQSGPWSWDVIFEGLSLAGDSRMTAQSAVANYVARGLRYWNLRLLTTQSMNLYLRTLVCQGGFPINTLRNEGAGISRLLKVGLRDHEQFPTEPIDEILSRYIHMVSPTLQITEVRTLAADLILAIALLRKRSEAACSEGISRLEFLDRNAPGWEKELPLRVEEPEAKSLLLSLLDTVKADPRSRHTLSIVTSLAMTSFKAEVSRSLRFPVTLSEEALRRACQIRSEDSLYPRMTGYLRTGETRVPAVRIACSSDGSTFRFSRSSSGSSVGDRFVQRTSLVFAVGDEEIHRMEVPGGEALPESPWILTCDDSHRLISVGSFRSHHESVLVAIPPNYEFNADTSSVTEDQQITVAGRRLVKLSGAVTLHGEGNLYRIVTNSTGTVESLYELRGRRITLGTGGTVVWCGAPTIWQIPNHDDATPQQVPSALVQWRGITKGDWSSNFSNCYGDVRLRVILDGETLYCTRCIVVSTQFALKVVPGQKTGEGELLFSGLGKCRLQSATMVGVTIAARRTADHCVIGVKVSGKRPSLLGFRLVFDNGNQCDLSVVCPTKSYAILDVLGEPIAFEAGIPLEKLDGLVLQVLQPGDQAPLIYWPDGPLLIDRMRETSVSGIYEFPLSFLTEYASELLACSNAPDGRVTFGVGNNVNFQPWLRWNVTRYAYSVSRAGDITQINGNESSTEIIVKGLDSLPASAAFSCQLSVVPLQSPNDAMPSSTIESKGPGKWIVYHNDYEPGYYLALVTDDQGTSYRPLRFVVKASALDALNEHADASRDRLVAVMNLFDNQARQRAWDRYFTELSSRPTDPDWSRIDDWVNASDSLPITTFEAVAALTRNHYAAARYGIQLSSREQIWQRFEQLPFLWSAIPIHVWIEVGYRYWQAMKSDLMQIGIDTQEIQRYIIQNQNHFVREVLNRSRHMDVVVNAMFASEGFTFDISLLRPPQWNQTVRERELARLLSYHNRFDTRKTWFNFPIACSAEERAFLLGAGLLYDDTHPNQWAVLNGPGIAAVKVVHGRGILPEEISLYKKIRAIDSEWYDTANAVAINVLLGDKCTKDPDCFRNLIASLSHD